jgi:hypothetical protein
MTVRELREVKKALKEAEERAHQAEQNYEGIRQAFESLIENRLIMNTTLFAQKRAKVRLYSHTFRSGKIPSKSYVCSQMLRFTTVVVS